MMSITTILQQQYHSIQTEQIRYQNNPYDSERVHDLRVAIRTLRGLVKFLKREMPQETYETLDRTLSNAAKIFSPLRDLDVLIVEAGAFAYAHPEGKVNYRDFFKMFDNKRHEEMQQTLVDSVQQELTTDLDQVKAQLKTVNFNHVPDWTKLIAKELKRRKHQLIKQYDHLDFQDYPRVHHVRKKAKTLRYSATYFAEFVPKKAEKIRRQAKRVQDVCGSITDAHVNYVALNQLASQTTDDNNKALLLRIARAQREKFTAIKKSAKSNYL